MTKASVKFSTVGAGASAEGTKRMSVAQQKIKGRDSGVAAASGVAPTVERHRVIARKRKRTNHPLRELRVRAGFTLEDLASAINSSPSYLSRLESGARRLNSDTIEQLSKALSCSPAELLPKSTYGTPATYGTASTSSRAANTNQIVDLPVYAIDGSKETGMLFLDAPVHWASRPPELLGINDAFACVIQNTRWFPRYFDGEILFVHPTAPLRPGVTMILVDHEDVVYLGRLKALEGDYQDGQVLVMAHTFDRNNDKKSFTQQEYKYAYRIIASHEAAI